MANITRRPERREIAPRGWFDPFRMMREMMRWDPFGEMETVAPMARTFVPSFDVKETNDEYVFKADLPGLKEEDVEISLTGNRLTVSGERTEEERKEDENVYSIERAYGAFSRSFTLPEGADVDRVQADMRDGVLTVHVPKRAETKPRKISVSAGQGRAPETTKAKA